MLNAISDDVDSIEGNPFIIRFKTLFKRNLASGTNSVLKVIHL